MFPLLIIVENKKIFRNFTNYLRFKIKTQIGPYAIFYFVKYIHIC